MRLLFVSGTTVGGSGRSQRELASTLLRRGHVVRFLVDDGRPALATRWAYEQLSDLSVRLKARWGAAAVTRVRDSLGRRVADTEISGLPHVTSPIPQNALPEAIRDFRPEVVVVSSVERWSWRQIHAVCRAAGVPSILYVREDDSLAHLSNGRAIPDVLVANAVSLAVNLEKQGYPCAFVPSVVDTSVTQTDSTRRVALAINPIRSRGGDILWEIAARLTDIPFVVQESWPLGPEDLAEVQAAVSGLPHVEFRRSSPPGPGLYGDARVLLVPYRVDNRPRVILEAQANGIPVIVGDVPALLEAMGAGGMSVSLESIDAWVAAIRALWRDEHLYEQLAGAARAHGRRPGVDPDAVTRSFEEILELAIEKREE